MDQMGQCIQVKGCLPQIFLGPFLNTLNQILLKKNVTKRSYFIFESSASISPNEGNDHNRSDFEEHPLIILPYFAAKKSK